MDSRKQFARCLTLLATIGVIHLDNVQQQSFAGDLNIKFATIDQGKSLLAASDDFVERMSPFDRAARLKTGKTVTEAEYLEFVGKNVLAWSEEEKQQIRVAVEGLEQPLRELSLPLPHEVLFIKTTGKEEGDAAYTRGNAIVLPASDLQKPMLELQRLICHELFHVVSRANPKLKEELYQAIGFEPCGELRLPDSLQKRKITNPDAPLNDHCIRVRVQGESQWVIPVLLSRSETYSTRRGGEFFNYMQLRFVVVTRDDQGQLAKADDMSDEVRLVSMQQVSEYFDQVGKNTGYIIHPEEILADNFALLVMNKPYLASPEVVERMRTIFRRHAVEN